MRILALTNLYPNPFQPHRAAFNRQQLKALAARHAVRVIAPVAWTDELLARRSSPARLPAGRRVVSDGIDVHHPSYLFPPKVLRGRYGHFFRRSVRRAFTEAVSEFGPDVVYASWAYPDGWAAVELAREARLPVVIKVHGSDVLLLGAHPGRRRRTIEALRGADAVVAVSRDLADHVASLGAERGRVSVVYNGIDTDLFCPGPAAAARARLGLDAGDPIILYVGNLVPVKGLDVLIDACARLAGRGAAFRCHLIGQGPLKPALERQIERLGLQDRVTLVGPRPLGQLPDWYRAASVVVLPSRSEGVPNVLLEATACGTPFVASRVGGIPEIAGGCADRLVLPGDPAALADALARTLSAAGEAAALPAFRPATWDESAISLARVFQPLAA